MDTYNKRRERLWNAVASTADAVLVTSPENVTFLCGFSGSEGTVLLMRDGGYFFTDGRYAVQAEQDVQSLKVVVFKQKLKEITSLVKRLNINEMAFESTHLTVHIFSALEQQLNRVKLTPCPDKLQMLRAVKDEAELTVLKEAAVVASSILSATLGTIRPGVREIDVAAEIEYQMKKNRTSGPAFKTIVASGHRSALPHGAASEKTINKGDFVTVDYGVVYKNYCTDETCTFVMGKPDSRQKEIYKTVKDAHDLAIAALCHGKRLKQVDAAARDHIHQAGYGKYFSHGTGHGLGLSVHEPPSVSERSKEKAIKSMVLTIEPGIYLPGFGGVRIEDTVVVTDAGCEIITKMDKKLISL